MRIAMRNSGLSGLRNVHWTVNWQIGSHRSAEAGWASSIKRRTRDWIASLL